VASTLKLLRSILRWLFPASGRKVPGNVHGRLTLSYSFFRQEKYLDAREQLLKALELRNDIQDAATVNLLLELLWWTWISPEQYREAAEFFSAYVEKHPADVRGHSLRASSLWYMGELQKAIDGYSTALESNPQDILSRSGRGQVLAESREFSRALEDLEFVHDNLEQAQLSESVRTQIQAYTLSGSAFAHAGLGELEHAMSEFDRSLFLCPDNSFAYFNRAIVYEEKGRVAEAVADYQTSLGKTRPKLTSMKRKYAEFKIKTIGQP
jgi:tetratricopeptide (TPR) repeat protein